MSLLVLSGLAFAAVAVAVAWPYLPSRQSKAGLSASERSLWVNRLFALVENAEDPAVASAARALIAALVAGPDAKKGR